MSSLNKSNPIQTSGATSHFDQRLVLKTKWHLLAGKNDVSTGKLTQYAYNLIYPDKLINLPINEIQSNYQYHWYQLARTTKSVAQATRQPRWLTTISRQRNIRADHNFQTKKYSWYISIKPTFRGKVQCFPNINGFWITKVKLKFRTNFQQNYLSNCSNFMYEDSIQNRSFCSGCQCQTESSEEYGSFWVNW